MSLLNFIARRSRFLFAITLLSGVISGAASAWIITLVNGGFKSIEDQTSRAAVFLAAVALLMIASYSTRRILLLISRNAVNELRLGMCHTLLKAPLLSIEQTGRSRIIAALAEDILVVSDTLAVVPVVCVEGAVMLACFCALAWLNPTMCLGLAFLFLCGVSLHTLIANRTQPYLTQGRDKWDELVTFYHDLVEGNKEIKLDSGSRKIFWEQHLKPAALELQDLSLKWHNLFASAGVFGQMFYFLAIGAVIFIGPLLGGDNPLILGTFSFMTIFLAGPIGAIVDAAPKYRRACIALDRLRGLGFVPEQAPPTDEIQPVNEKLDCQTLVVEDLCFEYPDPDRTGKSFAVGPINAEFRSGEITFIVGPNGSGKSSFVKLLCGLYPARQGAIRITSRSNEKISVGEGSENFSVVFSDFHLFSKHHGFSSNQEARARDYLSMVGLEEKITIDAGRFSTLNLSTGQRKRLALVIALVQDRPIYIFDEWASDQDPEFKDFFYRAILSDLKARGKIVIVVSHDHSYFGAADSFVQLSNGQTRSLLSKTGVQTQ